MKEQSESDYTGHIHYERLYRDLKYIFIRNEAIVVVVVTIEMIMMVVVVVVQVMMIMIVVMTTIC